MKVFEKIQELKSYLGSLKNEGQSIGFVPTMGALHQGHLSLVREANAENDVVVCSIFVNPIQFNNPDDLEKYPRELESDIQMLTREHCDVLFVPDNDEMYPEPVNENFDFGDLDKVMEGAFRPGHFQGVATVVKRLFEIVTPDKAYFGLKDYQQLLIIHHMTNSLKLPIEIVPCEIVREENGLAMSSRNKRLSAEEQKQAAVLYKTLKMIKIRCGFATVSELKKEVESIFSKQKNIKLEYFEIVDMYSLKPLRLWSESKNVIACIAAHVGDVRLIDNIILFS